MVGEAATAAEALRRVPAVRPDVAVLDVRLPDGDGIEVCRELRSLLPDLRCLMLTSFADDDALFGAIMAGASGYVLKQIRGTDLVGASDGRGRRVAAGPADDGAGAAADAGAPRSEGPARRLTEQERGARPHREGLTNREIGERMFLAEKTVKNYVSHLLAKLGMQRRIRRRSSPPSCAAPATSSPDAHRAAPGERSPSVGHWRRISRKCRPSRNVPAVLFVMMWSVVLPPETNPVVDDHIIGALALLGLALVHAGDTFGFGRWWKTQPIVARNRWLI